MAERALRPFWMHQLVEYIVGIAVLVQGLQDPEPIIPSLAGVLVIVNAAAVRGPLGAFKFIGRRIHRWLDLLVAAAIIVAAVQPWVPIEFTGRAILLIVLVPLGFLWYYTDWEERAGRKARRQSQAGDTGADLGGKAGRLAGNAWVAGKRAVRKRSQS